MKKRAVITISIILLLLAAADYFHFNYLLKRKPKPIDKIPLPLPDDSGVVDSIVDDGDIATPMPVPVEMMDTRPMMIDTPGFIIDIAHDLEQSLSRESGKSLQATERTPVRGIGEEAQVQMLLSKPKAKNQQDLINDIMGILLSEEPFRLPDNERDHFNFEEENNKLNIYIWSEYWSAESVKLTLPGYVPVDDITLIAPGTKTTKHDPPAAPIHDILLDLRTFPEYDSSIIIGGEFNLEISLQAL